MPTTRLRHLIDVEVVYMMDGDSCEGYEPSGIRAKGHHNPLDFIAAALTDSDVQDRWDCSPDMYDKEEFDPDRVQHLYVVDVPIQKYREAETECIECNHPWHYGKICGDPMDSDEGEPPCDCDYTPEIDACSIWVPRLKAHTYDVSAKEGYPVTELRIP